MDDLNYPSQTGMCPLFILWHILNHTTLDILLNVFLAIAVDNLGGDEEEEGEKAEEEEKLKEGEGGVEGEKPPVVSRMNEPEVA